jgi:hypothetical protein
VKAERRYALLGLVAWKLLKWQAANRVRRAGTSDRRRGLGRVVVALLGLATAAGVAFWYLGRGRDDSPPPNPPPPAPPPAPSR